MAAEVNADRDPMRKMLHEWVNRICDDAISIELDFNNEIVRDYDAEQKQASSHQIHRATGRRSLSVEWIEQEG